MISEVMEKKKKWHPRRETGSKVIFLGIDRLTIKL